MRHLVRIGADGLITNHPERLRGVLGAEGLAVPPASPRRSAPSRRAAGGNLGAPGCVSLTCTPSLAPRLVATTALLLAASFGAPTQAGPAPDARPSSARHPPGRLRPRAGRTACARVERATVRADGHPRHQRDDHAGREPPRPVRTDGVRLRRADDRRPLHHEVGRRRRQPGPPRVAHGLRARRLGAEVAPSRSPARPAGSGRSTRTVTGCCPSTRSRSPARAGRSRSSVRTARRARRPATAARSTSTAPRRPGTPPRTASWTGRRTCGSPRPAAAGGSAGSARSTTSGRAA